jgi:hypothetical protein
MPGSGSVIVTQAPAEEKTDWAKWFLFYYIYKNVA